MSKSALGAGIAIALAVVVPLTGYGINKSHHNKEVRSVYVQAQDMAERGQYAEAQSLLEEIAEEKYADMNISELYQYCEAQIEYESGHIALAYWDVNSLTLAHVSEELQIELEHFKEKISKRRSI